MILFKKAIRGVWRQKRAYIACVALMAIGIAMYTAYNLLYINLGFARDKMYLDQNFADAFAQVRAAPLTFLDRLEAIDGVQTAQGRVSADARALIEGKEEKIITLRLHSFDPANEAPLNDFLITQGTPPAENEVLVGNSFFEANNLKVGDTLSMIISGKRLSLTISGAALSPEYVYVIPDTGQMLPDNEAFGFGYITYAQLSSVTGEQGLCDMISFKLDPAVAFSDLKPALEDALTPYGLISLFERKDQSSAAMLDMEITSLGSMATSIPLIFVLMAVIILYIMLKRVIEQERGSIGTLKAFGFSDASVLTHYLCYGLIAGGAGGLLGCFLGLAMSGAFTTLYLDYFNLPALEAAANPMFMLNGMLIALASGAFGAFMGTKAVLKLSPAEAMRPPAPRSVSRDIFAILPFLRPMLATNGFMAVRNMSRSWFRSLFIVLGIAFSFSLAALTHSYTDMMDKMILEQYSKVLLYDVKVTLREPKAYEETLEAVYGAGSVSDAEGLLEIPAELRLSNLKENISITGLDKASRMQKIYDSNGEFYLEPPEGGLVISASLAKKLRAKRGDTLAIKTPYTGKEEIRVPVMGIVNEVLGMNAYMELEALCLLLGAPKSANAAILATSDPGAVKSAVESADNVSAVTDINESRRIYDEMLETYSSMFVMMQVSGMAIAYAIISNTASISLSERKREYATLRVLGLHPREIGKILGFEYWSLALIGIIPGIPLVYLLKLGMSTMIDPSMFTVPLSTPFASYIAAAVLCLLTVALCNVVSTRHIAKFDMVEALKERE